MIHRWEYRLESLGYDLSSGISACHESLVQKIFYEIFLIYY